MSVKEGRRKDIPTNLNPSKYSNPPKWMIQLTNMASIKQCFTPLEIEKKTKEKENQTAATPITTNTRLIRPHGGMSHTPKKNTPNKLFLHGEPSLETRPAASSLQVPCRTRSPTITPSAIQIAEKTIPITVHFK